MAWIESHTNLLRHKKVILTAKSLRIPPVYLIGHLHVLWHSTIEMAEDGDLGGLGPSDIAEAAAYRANAEMFVECLINGGWIDKAGESLLIHDWLDYAGLFLIGKYKTSNREKLERIWQKHGRVYGHKPDTPERKDIGSNKEGVRKEKGSLPNQPTNQTNQPAVRRVKSAAEIRKELYGI